VVHPDKARKQTSTTGNDPGCKSRFMNGIDRFMDALTLKPVHSSPFISCLIRQPFPCARRNR